MYMVFTVLRFQPDRGFSGADQAPTRDGPVQFEKDTEEDPFGLNKFLTEAKKAKRPVTDKYIQISTQKCSVMFHISYRESGASRAKRPKY